VTRPCPLCNGVDGFVLFERSTIPLSANVLYSTRDDARNAVSGRLTLSLCRRCGFIFNSAFDPTLSIYGVDYDNDQNFSERFTAHMRWASDRVRRAMATPVRVLEVGCGQGQFLDMLLGDDPDGMGIGFDPSVRRPSTPRLRFEARYFGAESGAAIGFEPNLVVSRHVIEHVQHPLTFLKAIRGSLRDGVRVFLETPCVAHILESGAFWDLCYEHCSYFSAATLAAACERAGFSVSLVEHVFAGQYLWLEARSGTPQERHNPPPPLASAERFRARIGALLTHWRAVIEQAALRGRVAVWGGGTKGASFVQLIDPDGTLIHAVIDINPRKQGRYLPGSGHRVLDWRQAVAEGVATAVVMNPNYLPEIRAMIGDASASLALISAEPSQQASP